MLDTVRVVRHGGKGYRNWLEGPSCEAHEQVEETWGQTAEISWRILRSRY